MARTRENAGAETKKESSSSRKNSSGKKKNGSTGVWPCTINGCTKQFAREADLKRHQRTTKLHATSVAGSQCPQCDATFTRTDALRRHQKSRHNGVVIEPDYELVHEGRVDASDTEEEGDASAEQNSGRSTSSPSTSTQATRRVAANSSRKTNSVESVGSASYYSSTQRGAAAPRAIMTAQQYANATHPTSATQRSPSMDWDDRYHHGYTGSGSDEEPITKSSNTPGSSYSQDYYSNHFSAPSSHSYWNTVYSRDRKELNSPRHRMQGSNHWRTSSQRTTASLDDAIDRDMSRSSSEEPSPGSIPVASPIGEDKFHAVALAVSANTTHNFKQSDSHMTSPRSSSSRSTSRNEDRHSNEYTSSYSRQYLNQAPSLRSTQIYYSSHLNASSPQPPRHQYSATRSTFSEEECEPSPMDFEEDFSGSSQYHLATKFNDVSPMSHFRATSSSSPPHPYMNHCMKGHRSPIVIGGGEQPGGSAGLSHFAFD